MLNLFSLPSAWNYYLFLKRIPYRPLWSHPRNRPQVNSRQIQSFAAANIPQRFLRCICSKLWSTCSVQSTYVFKHEQELVNKVFMLYLIQVGLLNKLLFSWCVTCTHTKLPQGPVHRFTLLCYSGEISCSEQCTKLMEGITMCLEYTKTLINIHIILLYKASCFDLLNGHLQAS